MADSGVRIADLLMALSLATDLGFGQPPEHMLRSARISMRLGERLGLETEDLASLYDVSILTYVGCPVYGNESALLFGDDIDFRSRAVEVDLAGFSAMLFMMRRAGSGTSAGNRARQIAALVGSGGRKVVEQMANHCSAASALAARLGLSDEVQAGVAQAYARWDGRGVPRGLSGEAVSLSARIAHVAEACEVFQRTAGVDGVVDVVRSRSGSHFDPEIAAAAQRDLEGLFAGVDEDTVDALLESEPRERAGLSEDEFDDALEAIGDFCDLRCPYFVGHAATTARLVAEAAEALETPTEERRLAYRAALVHDAGSFGVPGSVWDKQGALSPNEQERMRLHTYYVERIFNRPEPLRRIGLLAATHHERMDGSGYHRGAAGPMLSTQARILAAADAFQAMSQPRPHRDAIAEHDILREMRSEVSAGRLDAQATEAVLAAAGHEARHTPTNGRAGLTAREVDVLLLLAEGLPNKGIAGRLEISPKTVGNHVEHIYLKLGVSNRAGAAMQAMQLGLVGGSVPASKS